MEDEFDGNWIVVGLPSGHLIGKMINRVGDIFTLNPAYDFHSSYQQIVDPETRKTGMARMSFCSLPGALTKAVPVSLCLDGGYYYQFSEMDDSDREEYKKLVRQAAEQARQVRINRSGLSLAREIPKGMRD